MKSEALDLDDQDCVFSCEDAVLSCIWPTSLPVSWAWQGCDPGICCITAPYSHMVHHQGTVHTPALQSLTHSHREDFFSVKHNHFEPTHCTRGVPSFVKQNNLCGCMLNMLEKCISWI